MTSERVSDQEKGVNGRVHVRGLSAASGGGLYWAKEYATDDAAATMYPVAVTDKSNPSANENRVVFIFTQAGKDVHWDPEVKFDTDGAASTAAAAGRLGASLLAAATALLLALLL